MYVYIYDDYLNKKKYYKTINRLEIRLTDLGLNGKIIRLNSIKNVKKSIQNELRLGAQTIIAVGNNQTVNKVIEAMANNDFYGDFENNSLLGIIPIGDNNSIANSFGIKNEMSACDILLARRIEKIDLGLVNQHYFLNQAIIQAQNTNIKIQDFSLQTTEKGNVEIINLANKSKANFKSNPHDGLLDVYINMGKNDTSYLKTEKLNIYNPEHKLIIDEVLEIETPVDISIKKNIIQVVVGKDRTFV